MLFEVAEWIVRVGFVLLFAIGLLLFALWLDER